MLKAINPLPENEMKHTYRIYVVEIYDSESCNWYMGNAFTRPRDAELYADMIKVYRKGKAPYRIRKITVTNREEEPKTLISTDIL